MRGIFVLLIVAVSFGCAQPRQPTGGEPREIQPLVVDVSPEPFSTITDLGRPVIIRFDERLSERLDGVRELRDAVLVSPETGPVRARRGRRHVEISVAGGWQPGLVYRVVLLPVLRDLFGNVRTDPVELVFSTGAAIDETAVAGLVEDRITGRAAAGARVEAVHRDAGHTYVAVTDTAGFFALRHVPEGPYEMTAWMDQDRDREADFHEPQDTASFTLVAQDTVLLEVRLLPQDTTPARLARATAIDSTKIELAFDDYFEPGPVTGRGRIYRTADSTYVMDGSLFHATQLDSLHALDRAPDETLADTVAPTDTVPADTPLPMVRPTTRPTAGTQPPAPQRRLPANELILLLPRPLEPDEAYYVVVEGVTNIQGVPDGGGTRPFQTPARPPPPDPDDEDPDAEDPDAEDRPPPDAVPPDDLSVDP